MNTYILMYITYNECKTNNTDNNKLIIIRIIS